MKELAKVSYDFRTPSRTNYQLRHFVVYQHDTPEMQYRQIIIEAKHLFHNLKLCELNVRLQEMKIDKLRAKADEKSQIKLAIAVEHLRVQQQSIEDMKLELDYLAQLFLEYPAFTPQQIEDNQEIYWKLRLNRQVRQDQVALERGTNAGNISSLEYMGPRPHQDRELNSGLL